MNDLEIFKLGSALVQALQGEEEAIADIKKLYNDHPEMFSNIKQVSEVINDIAQNYEIIVDAAHSKNDKLYFKAAKRLDEEKMGDIVVKNDNGTNEIFHANRKNMREFNRLVKQVETGGKVAHFLHPDIKSAWAGSKEHSPASSDEIIPQQSKQKDKLVINIFGAPGVGKSTLAKNLQEYMSKYKPALVEEFATFLIKEGRENELENQTFVSSNQAKMLENGFKQSNLVISDSPIDLGIIYNSFNANKNDKESSDYTFEVHNIVNNANTKYESIDIFIKHDQKSEKGYSMQDRVHTLQESKFLEEDISRYLLHYERKPIVVDRSCDIEILIDTIKENPKFKEFAKSNRFANLKKPSDTPNNDTPNSDKSKDTNGRDI